MIRVTVRARPGHPWVFANEIVDPPVASLPPGDQVEVVDPAGRLLGRAYANPQSLITLRFVARGAVDIDAPALYVERLAEAVALRRRLLPSRRSYRVVAGEADGLPGFILDRYEDVVVAQITTLGMERRRHLLEAAVREVIAPRGAMLRNDVASRVLEGLEGDNAVWFGDVPDRVAFDENGVKLVADVREGQKTGFFFDQAENRRFLAERCDGARVLDLYAHSGAWALGALLHGASHALAVDVSGPACATIEENASLNGVQDRLEVWAADARDALARIQSERRRFDVVCVDPPAFAKSRKKAGIALSAYRAVNTEALRCVAPGGLFFTSSCSHHVLAERFEEAVESAAVRAGRRLLRVRKGGQAPDHPVLPGVPETEYLKHLVYVVR